MTPCDAPIELGVLAAYRAAELDAAAQQAVEEHYFACASCAARLAWLEALSSAVRDGIRCGAVSSAVSSKWLAEAEAHGVRLRTYTLSPGASVACTAAPTDDFVVVCLHVAGSGGTQVDVDTTFMDLTTGSVEHRRVEDLSVDPVSSEVVYAFSGDEVRSFPRSRWVMQVRPRGSAQADSVGPYTMNHTPWAELDSSL